MVLPVITITLNPALDLSAEVPQVEPGRKLRTGPVTTEPGGGGLNVARALAILGGRALALACLGGPTGDRLASLLAETQGLELSMLPTPGDTRESLTVTEAASGAQYRFVLPGPQFDDSATAPLIAAIARQVPAGALVVLSGSQPPGLPSDFPQQLRLALPPDTGLIVDTSGPALTRLIAAPMAETRPMILRLDAAEAEAQAGATLETEQASIAQARDWVARGVADSVVLARGSEGSVLVSGAGAWTCAPPRVPVVSKVGAGDSFVAGLAMALARGDAPAEALRLATAAAAAAVMSPGSALCRAEDVARLIPQCRLSRP